MPHWLERVPWPLSVVAEVVMREWPVIRQAPRSFGTAVVLSVVLCVPFIWWGASAGYGRELDIKQASIDSLDRELRRFQRLEATGPKTTVEQNRILREETLQLVGNLRDLVSSAIRILAEQSRFATASRSIFGGPDALPPNLEMEYERRFKVRAIVLRDSLLLRMPVNRRDDAAMRRYGNSSLSDVRAIADDLERLARQLSD